jgi:hypothetical protein
MTPSNNISCCAQVELLQVGPKGDLILGSTNKRVSTLTTAGTLVEWIALKDAANQKTAEVCLVLRFMSGKRLRHGSSSTG